MPEQGEGVDGPAGAVCIIARVRRSKRNGLCDYKHLKDADALREAWRDVPWLLIQNGKDPSLNRLGGLDGFCGLLLVAGVSKGPWRSIRPPSHFCVLRRSNVFC